MPWYALMLETAKDGGCRTALSKGVIGWPSHNLLSTSCQWCLQHWVDMADVHTLWQEFGIPQSACQG
jgi:hypothetical protein